MVEVLLWLIGIGLFFTYGLPVLFLALSLIGGIACLLFGWMQSIFKGGKNG